jgi:L-ascorbate metabolism protein UlaG (beta-lactamase superfamily)
MPDDEARGDRLHFVGNATSLLHLGGFTVLTDPNFLHAGQRAYLGYGLVSKRLRDPALQVDQLPPLDAVLLSHLHGDHWDRVAERGLDREVPVVTTVAAARTLARRGFRTEGLATWEPHELVRGDDRLRVTAVPGRHGRGALARLLPPVMGSLIDVERAGQRRLRLYVSGDTLLVHELREIGQRFPDIDVAVVHLGGTRLLKLMLVTMDGREGAELVRLIDPAAVVPVHIDDYTVFTSPLSDFTSELVHHGLADRLRVVERGSSVALLGRAAPH